MTLPPNRIYIYSFKAVLTIYRNRSQQSTLMRRISLKKNSMVFRIRKVDPDVLLTHSMDSEKEKVAESSPNSKTK